MTPQPEPERHDVWQLADAIQMDLRAAQAKLVELRSRLAQLNLADASKVTCPRCGVPQPGSLRLAEHMYHSHGGPEPEHWLAIEKRSLPAATHEEIQAAMAEGAERNRAALEAAAATAPEPVL